MRLRIILSLILFCILQNSFSQSTTCVDSSTRFLLQSGNSHIFNRDNIVLSDSTVIIIGSIRDDTQADSSLFIARLDKNNNILFSKRINGLRAFPQKIIQCRNGDILVAVIKYFNGYVQEPWLFRLDINGNVIWQKQIEIIATPTNNTGSFRGTRAIFEAGNGNIYLTESESKETNNVTGTLSGYYYIYKLGPSGNIIWKTTLIQNDNFFNSINAIKEETGIVFFITQQYYQGNHACNATNSKSIGLFRLNDSNGGFIDSKVFCLNFSGTGCLGVQDSYYHSATFLADGRIIVTGMVALCGLQYSQTFTLETDNNFNPTQCYSYNYVVPFSISNGVLSTDRFGQVTLLSRGWFGNKIYYATITPDSRIVRQRKLDLLPGETLSIGAISPAYKKPDDFLIFTNLRYNNNEVLQVMEFKGNNNQITDCTGEDTSFITSQPHYIVPIAFTWDTIRTETVNAVPTNFTFNDFAFQRIEICSSISICDSLKIHGKDSICLNNADQIFTAYRNPDCNKKPAWKIDTSAIYFMQQLNDTTVKIKFKRPWQGYLYAYSSSCTRLSDSMYLKVFDPVLPLSLGRDTAYCGPVVLDAGDNYLSYQWQDNSANRYFTVTSPGMYYVTAKDICSNTYTDTIFFSPKKTSVYLGRDTCVAHFPFIVSAGDGFNSYLWQDGSTSQQFSIDTPGLYHVTVSNFCNELYKDSIRVYKSIQPFSLGIDTFLCPGNTIQLQALTGYQQYQWQDRSNEILFPVVTDGMYYVTVTDFCGKSYTDTIKIIPLVKKINLGSDISICKKESIQLTAKGNFASYSWTPLYNISSSSSQSVTVNPEQTTMYYIRVQTAEGCIAKDSITIYVKDCPETFYIPTGFTPNNDGKNDIFKPIISGRLENYQFVIYNRWGQVVFKSRSDHSGWDGKLNGTLQDSNVFIWMCTYKFFDQPAISRKGNFILIR